jgi:cytochrome c5
MNKLIVVALFMLASIAQADESKVILKDGPGKDVVEAQCGICHSNDFILTNARILDHKGWEKVVDKMIKVMGAPMLAEDVPVTVDYLTKYYGK